jgi:hypothetical protein
MIKWPYFTAEELAGMAWTTPGYVRNLAVKGNWRRRRRGRQILYAYEDAAKDLHAHSEERRRRLIAERHAREKAASEDEYQRYYGNTQVEQGA